MTLESFKALFGWKEIERKYRKKKEIERKRTIFLCLVVEENV